MQPIKTKPAPLSPDRVMSHQAMAIKVRTNSTPESIAKIRAILMQAKRMGHTVNVAHAVGVWPT